VCDDAKNELLIGRPADLTSILPSVHASLSGINTFFEARKMDKVEIRAYPKTLATDLTGVFSCQVSIP